MKLALNGALTIGTLDGANIEMRDEVGADNIFVFGMTTAEVAARACRPATTLGGIYDSNLELAPGARHDRERLTSRLRRRAGSCRSSNALTTFGDHFMLLADYADYVACQARVDTLFQQPDEWARRAILNVAGMGNFSSDRTVREYAREVWNISPG